MILNGKIYSNYFVTYTNGFNDYVKTFYLKSELDKFIYDFLLKHQRDDENNIELVYSDGCFEYHDHIVEDEEESKLVTSETVEAKKALV